MDFRRKLENALAPLISELRQKLASLSTVQVLNHYQLQIDLVQTDKSKVPDGFMHKWRYLWALLLANPFLEGEGELGSEMKQVDQLIEDIFRTYGIGALYEPGHTRGSEKEFLTRLGLAIKVREPDTLGFPEQIKDWATTRFEPFNDSYFLLVFGIRFEEIIAWFGHLLGVVQSRLNTGVRDYATILKDAEKIRAEFVEGNLDLEGARSIADDLKIEDRINENSQGIDRIHIFSREELEDEISASAIQALITLFGLRSGETNTAGIFPHDENPLEYKTFVELPVGEYYFLDPASAYRIVAKTFERELLRNNNLRAKYLKHRDRSAEQWVTGNARKVFPSASIYQNYYLERGSYEKDLLIQYEDSVILVECKNSRVRTFTGATSDLTKFERDFEHSVQYGYDQALAVKQRILESEQSEFLDDKGRPYFSIRRSDVERFYILCINITPRGPFGTDLSYELKKPSSEPFPLAVNLFDFDTICKHLNTPQLMLGYLQARERLHGRTRTGDELNYAGYFLQYGNLELQDHTFLTDEFSGVFDRAWFREKGVEVDEPRIPVTRTSMIREGNRVTFQTDGGRKEVVRFPPELIERSTGKAAIRMKGSERNEPCPCGSGRKFKYCHGIS
jgi:hypothetical protein